MMGRRRLALTGGGVLMVCLVVAGTGWWGYGAYQRHVAAERAAEAAAVRAAVDEDLRAIAAERQVYEAQKAEVAALQVEVDRLRARERDLTEQVLKSLDQLAKFAAAREQVKRDVADVKDQDLRRHIRALLHVASGGAR